MFIASCCLQVTQYHIIDFNHKAPALLQRYILLAIILSMQLLLLLHLTVLLLMVDGNFEHVWNIHWLKSSAECAHSIMCYYIPPMGLLSLTVGEGEGEGADAASEQCYPPPPPPYPLGDGDVEGCQVNVLDPMKAQSRAYENPLPGRSGAGLIYGPRRWEEFGTWAAAAEAPTAAALTLPPLAQSSGAQPPNTPHSSLLSHCFIYSWLTCSRGSAPPFWGVEISSKGLYNFKWWQWLFRLKGGSWHREVIKRIDGVLMHTVQRCTLILSDLFILFY